MDVSSKPKYFTPGDVDIVAVDITGSEKRSLLGQMMSIDIFEDIEECSLHAEISVYDSVNLLKIVPIQGSETVEISFKTTGRDDIVTYKLYCFSMSPVADIGNNRGMTYTLYCTTNEHMVNATKVIDTSYKNTIDNIIDSILKVELKSSKNYTFDKSRGITPISIPRLSPFATIDMLRKRAISYNSTGGVFMFYEDKNGYNLKTLENLVAESGRTASKFNYRMSTVFNTSTALEAQQFNNILDYRQLTRFNSHSQSAEGTFKNQVISYDVLTNKVSEFNFKFSENLGAFNNTDTNTIVPFTNDFINQSEKGDPYYMFVPRDRSRPDDNIYALLGYKLAYTNLFNTNIVRIHTFGDTDLTVGNGVHLELPNQTGFTDGDVKQAIDFNNTGNYVVAKLRRTITATGYGYKHHMTMDCHRIGSRKT